MFFIHHSDVLDQLFSHERPVSWAFNLWPKFVALELVRQL
jgi:hypothetical protein